MNGPVLAFKNPAPRRPPRQLGGFAQRAELLEREHPHAAVMVERLCDRLLDEIGYSHTRIKRSVIVIDGDDRPGA